MVGWEVGVQYSFHDTVRGCAMGGRLYVYGRSVNCLVNQFPANPAKTEYQKKKERRKKNQTRINIRNSENNTFQKKTGKKECKQNKILKRVFVSNSCFQNLSVDITFVANPKRDLRQEAWGGHLSGGCTTVIFLCEGARTQIAMNCVAFSVKWPVPLTVSPVLSNPPVQT